VANYSQSTQRIITNTTFLNPNTSICFNVYYHILRTDSGSGGFNAGLLDDVTQKLNDAFNPHLLSVNNLGYGYIDSSTYYNIDDGIQSTTEFDQLVQINSISNAINIYIVNDANYLGRADGILSQALVIKASSANTQIISHEVGHCLDLWHTFHGTSANEGPSALYPFACPELIDGSNCEDCGDYVCDTPADAFPQVGGGYFPDVNNIMSYYSNVFSFTHGQNVRIREAFASSALLQNIISTSCAAPELSNVDFICNGYNATFNLSNIDNLTTIWQASTNLTTIASTNTSITVETVNSFTTGEAWVEATLSNGLVLRDEFWLGAPSSNGLVIYSSGNFQISTNRWYQLVAHHNNFTYAAHGQLDYEWQIPYAQLMMSPPQNKTITVLPTQTGTYPYRLRSINSCGCSDWTTTFFTVSQRPGRDDLFIDPNN
jgi:hypothetical protein